MNYQYHYDELIRTRGKLDKPKGVYTEGHHIIPKSMGGTDEDNNIVYLSAREHYVAHFLLWKIHRNMEMTYAFRLMNANKGILGSRRFRTLREEYSKHCSERLSGRKNTPEQMKKQAAKVIAYYKRRGVKDKVVSKGVWSEESKQKQSARMLKKHHLSKEVMIDGEVFHSAREAARQKDVSHRTIGRWVKTGKATYLNG